jgi:hypothetical protein
MAEDKMTLSECAHCVQQLNTDLQRQTNAYRYFTQAKAHLHNLVHEDKVDGSKRLPFVTFTFPDGANKPGEYKLDLNNVAPEALQDLEPLFEILTDEIGKDLLVAWGRLIHITDTAKPHIAEARHALSADVV